MPVIVSSKAHQKFQRRDAHLRHFGDVDRARLEMICREVRGAEMSDLRRGVSTAVRRAHATPAENSGPGLWASGGSAVAGRRRSPVIVGFDGGRLVRSWSIVAAQPLSDPIVIVGEMPHAFRIGMVGPVVATRWFGPADAAAARALARVTSDVIARQQGQRFSNVHLIDRRVRIPDAETRGVLVQLGHETAGHLACVGVIIEGEGFWASAVRGVITGLRVITPSLDIHAHASIAQVLNWLPSEHEKRTGVPIDRAQVEHLLREAKRWRDAESRSA